MAYRAATVALVSALVCSCTSQLPTPGSLPDTVEARQKAVQRFMDESPLAIERIKVPKSSMRAVSLEGPLPDHISSMEIDIKFPGQHEATLSSLVQTLNAVNVRVAFQWSQGQDGEAILDRRLPFLGFQGTIGELMSALRTGLGIVTWYKDGMIYMSDRERYAISLPQNEEVLSSVSEEIQSLGAENVTTSIRGGKVIYTASPSTQDHVIGPFLDRMRRNLAIVNLQVAVVSLALNDSAEAGFDWNAFQAAFDSTQAGMENIGGTIGGGSSSGSGNNGAGDGTGNGGNGNGSNNGSGNGSGNGGSGNGGGFSAAELEGTAAKLVSTGLSLSTTNLGNVFGTYGALTVGGALKFLSKFGTTNVTQNVSLKTLSGTTVTLRSGQEVPYVSDVSNTSNSDNIIGSTETDTVETGLTLEMVPYYDSDAELVTVEVDVKLDAILDFVELSAGNQIGSLTQPLVQNQNMNDIVSVQAGRTVVIGGLQYDSESENGSEPAFLRKRLQGTGRSTGSTSREVSRSALFIIVRPTVTVYEPEA